MTTLKRLWKKSLAHDSRTAVRRWRKSIARRVEALENRYALAAQLTTTPITWEVLGLDSNKPLISGPNQYLIGARITNTGTETVSGVSAAMSLGDTVKLNATNQWAKQASTFITANGPVTSASHTLAPGQSVDVYFGVQIARDTKAEPRGRPDRDPGTRRGRDRKTAKKPFTLVRPAGCGKVWGTHP